MKTDVPPNCWTWCDEAGTQHLVVEGTPVLMGPKTVPTFKSMCGNDIPIGVLRPSDEFSICERCNVRLVDMIARALNV